MQDGNTFGGRRIMVVEDDYLVVTDLIDRLQAMGAEVIGPVPNLEKAFERLERLPDIAGAVLDVNVAGEMIFPLAEELKRRSVPFIFATGYDEDAIPAEYASVQRFAKPASDSEIALALLDVVGH
jgi:two-component SAPR family response regulator